MLFGPNASPALFPFVTYNFFSEFSESCFFFFPFMLSVEFTAQNSGETDREMQKLTTY